MRLLWVEFLENDFSADHEILHAYREQSAPQNAWNDITSCFRPGANATNYCTKVRKTGFGRHEAHNSVTIGSKFTSMTHWNWQNVCRDCRVEWCGVLPSPTNWWACCYVGLSRSHRLATIYLGDRQNIRQRQIETNVVLVSITYGTFFPSHRSLNGMSFHGQLNNKYRIASRVFFRKTYATNLLRLINFIVIVFFHIDIFSQLLLGSSSINSLAHSVHINIQNRTRIR